MAGAVSFPLHEHCMQQILTFALFLGIFIIEGALTCFLGFVGYWALVDFPDKAHKSWRFLTEREARFIIERVNRDRGDAKVEPWSLAKFLKGGTDIKIWGFAMVCWNHAYSSYRMY